MKKEINGSESVYLIAIFLMPIITLVGITLLQQEVFGLSTVIEVGKNDLSRIFFDEIVLFLICWVGLFISYILYKFNIRIAQYVLIAASLLFLILNAYATVTKYASISDIINPVVLLSSTVYAIFNPLPESVTQKRIERTKNSIKKITKKTK